MSSWLGRVSLFVSIFLTIYNAITQMPQTLFGFEGSKRSRSSELKSKTDLPPSKMSKLQLAYHAGAHAHPGPARWSNWPLCASPRVHCTVAASPYHTTADMPFPVCLFWHFTTWPRLFILYIYILKRKICVDPLPFFVLALHFVEILLNNFNSLFTSLDFLCGLKLVKRPETLQAAWNFYNGLKLFV